MIQWADTAFAIVRAMDMDPAAAEELLDLATENNRRAMDAFLKAWLGPPSSEAESWADTVAGEPFLVLLGAVAVESEISTLEYLLEDLESENLTRDEILAMIKENLTNIEKHFRRSTE